MNFAIASGLAAAETVKLAHAEHDFSALSMSRYRKKLEDSFVLQDLKKFRHAPDFVNNERLQNLYPELFCQTAENLFRSNGTPRPQIGRVAFDTLRGKVPLHTHPAIAGKPHEPCSLAPIALITLIARKPIAYPIYWNPWNPCNLSKSVWT